MPIGTKDELLKEIVAVEAGSNPKRLICHLAKQNIRQQGRIERQFATITEQNMAIAELRGTIGRLVQAVELLDEKFEERENRKRKSSALDEKLDPDPPKKIRGSSTESNTTTNDVLDLPLNSASIASTSDENQCEDEVASVSLL